jgi:hypothetical protein
VESIFAVGHQRLGPRAVLLDNQCSRNASVVCNGALLKNIRPCDPIKVAGVGSRTFSQQGDTVNFGTVLYDPDFVANVLSFSMVSERYEVQWLQYAHPPMFVVNLPNGNCFKFKKDDTRNGLYIHWLPETTPVSLPVVPAPAMDTVEERKALYTHKEIQAAETYRTFQAGMAFSSDKDNSQLLKRITNAPITSKAIGLSQAIYGPSVPILKGKTVHTVSVHFEGTC